MRKNKIKFILVILFSLIFFKNLTAEIIILSDCDSKKDGFLKNEYILDLNKSLMTRNYVYNQKTFEKYKVTDLSIKKENSLTRFIYTDDEKKIWKLENTTDEWKQANLNEIKKRLSGWQLESFEESYNHKIKNGISLFKKSLLNE